MINYHWPWGSLTHLGKVTHSSWFEIYFDRKESSMNRSKDIELNIDEIFQDEKKRTTFLLNFKKLIQNEKNVEIRNNSLSALGFLYFLFSEHFDVFTEEELSLIRNPITRIRFITNILISDTESLEEFNYFVDDCQTYKSNIDLFETTHYPFIIDIVNKTIAVISTGSIYYYDIILQDEEWAIRQQRHGHFRAKQYREIYLDYVRDFQKVLNQHGCFLVK